MKFVIKEREINGLAADVYEPESEKVKGTIIMLSGYCGSRKAPHRIKRAMTFAENGFKVVTWDYRSIVEGTPTETPTKSINGLLSVIKELNCNVGLFGESYGGFISINTANQSDKVKVIGIRAPVIDVEHFKSRYLQRMQDKWLKKHTSPKINQDISKYNSYEIAEKLHVPVLMFVGTKDISCPPQYAKKFFGLLKGEKKLVEFGAGHDWTEEELVEKTTSESLAWFNKYLAE